MLKLKSKEKKEEPYWLNHKGIKIIDAFFLISQCGAQQGFECRQKYREDAYPFVVLLSKKET